MKFSTVFVTVASLASMTAAVPATISKRGDTETVKLWVESPGNEIDEKGISAKHEGDSLSYIFFDNSTEELKFDKSSKKAYLAVGEYNWPFAIEKGVGQFKGSANGAEFTFTDDYVAINGTTAKFAACKNLDDPYGYSKNDWALTYYDGEIPDDCVSFKLKRGD